MLKKNYILFYLLILSILFIQCSDNPTEPPKDTTPPTIISTSPINNATNIPITDSVIIVFSEKILSSTVNNTSIAVSANTPTISLIDSIAILKFTTQLNFSTIYTVSISTDITDLSGNKLQTEYNFSFTTEADPAILPPSIVSTYPAIGAEISAVTDSVTVTFSKNIDTATLNDTTFFNTNGRTGTISFDSQTKTAIFQPTSPFAYDSSYIMSITTSVKDTAGNSLVSPLAWLFTTPTVTPIVQILDPLDSMIIGDTLTFLVAAENPIGIDTIQFYIDNVRVDVKNYTPSLVQYLLDASTFEVGSEHTMYAIAYDSLGNFGYSDTLTFFYLWQLVKTDGNDGFNQLQVPNDLRKMFARSTDSTLELRYEYGYDWVYPYGPDSATCTRTYTCGDTTKIVSCADTAVDLGIYIDADLNIATGRRDAAADTLNDIGAEYRIILGMHGGDTTLSVWSSSTSRWELLYDTTGLMNHNIPRDTNIMEIGLLWKDIGSPNAIDIVNINVFFRNFCDKTDFLNDFMPDRSTNSHVRIIRDNRYIGPLPTSNFKRNLENKSLSTPALQRTPNPFD